jgi:putative redox protein
MSETRITLRRIGEPFHFEAQNATGNRVEIDAGAAIGGTGKGARPMELLLMGLAGCAGIDVISILQKQRQSIESIEIDVVGVRGESKLANPFTQIRMVFALRGTIEESHLKRAIELSMEKYCSVAKTLEKTATITWEYTLNA